MLPPLLKQIFKNKNEAEKWPKIFWRRVIITLMAISIFVNISMNMKKGRTCWWIIFVKINKESKDYKRLLLFSNR